MVQTEVQSQEEYQKKYNDLSERYNKLKDELDKLINDRAYKLGQSTKLEAFLKINGNSRNAHRYME